MKLNTAQNIELCKKALLTKELQYYAKLCELYEQLALMQEGNSTAYQLENKYTSPLTMAARGDIEFTKPENNYINGKPLYNEHEISIFTDYAFFSKRLRQFQEAFLKLSNVIKESPQGKTYIDSTTLADYNSFMQRTSKSTRLFANFINEHTRQGTGHHYYLASKQAIRRINAVDNKHLPIDKFIRDITPQAFGAIITKPHSHERIKENAKHIFSRQDADEFRREPNIIKEAAHVIGKKAQKFVTKHKSQVRGIMVGTACVAMLLGGANFLQDREAFKDLDIKTNVEQGYQNYVSQETINKLSAIRTAIENAENSTKQPTYEDLNSIRHDLDDVIDDVMSDLVTEAFETRNPDCKVTTVETRYDKTLNMYATNEPHPENFCEITYINERGEQDRIVIHEFTSLAGNPIGQSFDNEYELDSNSPSVDSTDNFIKQGADVMEILANYRKILEDTEHLAGTRMIYSGGFIFTDSSLKTILPEKLQYLQENQNKAADERSDDTNQAFQEDELDER